MSRKGGIFPLSVFFERADSLRADIVLPNVLIFSRHFFFKSHLPQHSFFFLFSFFFLGDAQ